MHMDIDTDMDMVTDTDTDLLNVENAENLDQTWHGIRPFY
jgi:hypothetical protein